MANQVPLEGFEVLPRRRCKLQLLDGKAVPESAECKALTLPLLRECCVPARGREQVYAIYLLRARAVVTTPQALRLCTRHQFRRPKPLSNSWWVSHASGKPTSSQRKPPYIGSIRYFRWSPGPAQSPRQLGRPSPKLAPWGFADQQVKLSWIRRWHSLPAMLHVLTPLCACRAGSIACALISAFGAVFMAFIAILLANDYP